MNDNSNTGNPMDGRPQGSPQRRSIRLKGYDYSAAGLYFITICTQDRACLFGEVIGGEMILNEPGKMVIHWYHELENKFRDIKCGPAVVMPNHFHCIIENVGPGLHGVVGGVGADLRVRPVDPDELAEPTTDILGEPPVLGEHVGSPLHRVVQWFKTMTTNHYIRGVKQAAWFRFNGKLWQRNYWEHIIRNETAYHRISEYIINNPQNWEKDKLRSHQ